MQIASRQEPLLSRPEDIAEKKPLSASFAWSCAMSSVSLPQQERNLILCIRGLTHSHICLASESCRAARKVQFGEPWVVPNLDALKRNMKRSVIHLWMDLALMRIGG
jgi:hypothetical protein